MIKRYAIIKNNKIDNICLWDGIEVWEVPENATVIEAESYWGIGGTLVDGQYNPPVPFVPPGPPPGV